jgi:hypothetical protein
MATADGKTATTEEKSKDSLQREAYGAATKRIREDNRSTFNLYMQEEMKARGLEWAPKPTAEEKAEAQLQAILAEHPGLAARITGDPEGYTTTAEQPAP